jgi:hypothetical protein
MNNLAAALDLAAQGLPVFACQSSGDDRKKPQPRVFWRSAATTEARAIRTMWDRFPDSAPGVNLEQTPYFVVDCDTKDADGPKWFATLCTENQFDLATVPIIRTPSGGWHVYFRRPSDFKVTNARGSLPPKGECGIDIRGSGGYVIGPGARLDNGCYEMTGPRIEAAPECPAFLAAILRPKPSSPPPAPRIWGGGAENAGYAQAALKAEADAVAAAPEGARNETLNKAAFSLGQLVAGGALRTSEVTGVLASAAESAGLPAKEIAATLRSGLSAGAKQPRTPPERPGPDPIGVQSAANLTRAREICVNPDHDPYTGEIVERDLSDAALRPGGLVESIADWIVENSFRPCRLFATAAALTAVGTLMGRKIACEGSGTNLYQMIVAGTAFGKDDPQELLKMLLDSAGDKNLHFPAQASAAKLGVTLATDPVHVQIIDEIDSLLGKVQGKNSTNQERALLQSYCTLWGKSFGQFSPEGTLSRGNISIKHPCVSIFGATTPSSFYTQLKSALIAGGFLNRFIVLPRFERPKINEGDRPYRDTVPAHLANAAQWLIRWTPSGGNLGATTYLASAATPGPVLNLPLSPEAKARLKAYNAELEAYADLNGDGPKTMMRSRLADMAKRLALIVTIGHHIGQPLHGVQVGLAALDWAINLLEWSASEFARGIDDHLAETQHQADAKLVAGYIREARRIRRSALLKKLDHKLDSRAVKSILELLVDAGDVEMYVEAQEGSRQKSTWYRWRG